MYPKKKISAISQHRRDARLIESSRATKSTVFVPQVRPFLRRCQLLHHTWRAPVHVRVVDWTSPRAAKQRRQRRTKNERLRSIEGVLSLSMAASSGQPVTVRTAERRTGGQPEPSRSCSLARPTERPALTFQSSHNIRDNLFRGGRPPPPSWAADGGRTLNLIESTPRFARCGRPRIFPRLLTGLERTRNV